MLGPPIVDLARKQATLDGVDRANVVLGTAVGTGIAGLVGSALLSVGPEAGRAAGFGFGLTHGAGGAMIAASAVTLMGAGLIGADALMGVFTSG